MYQALPRPPPMPSAAMAARLIRNLPNRAMAGASNQGRGRGAGGISARRSGVTVAGRWRSAGPGGPGWGVAGGVALAGFCPLARGMGSGHRFRGLGVWLGMRLGFFLAVWARCGLVKGGLDGLRWVAAVVTGI